MNNDKPNPAKYNLSTDEGRRIWNNALDEYYKREKLNGGPIPADNIYKSVKKLKAYNF